MGGFFQQANDAAIAQSARDSVALAATPPVATGGDAATIAGRIETQVRNAGITGLALAATMDALLDGKTPATVMPMFTTVNHTPALAPDADTIALYNLSGGSLSDESGNGYTLTLRGEPVATLSENGLCTLRANDQRALTDNIVNLNGVTDVTIESWQRWSGDFITGTNETRLVSWNGDANNHLVVKLRDDLGFRINGAVNGTTFDQNIKPAGYPILDTFFHFAVQVHCDGAASTVQMFLDGNRILDYSTTLPATGFGDVNGRIYLGWSTLAWNGCIDNVRISSSLRYSGATITPPYRGRGQYVRNPDWLLAGVQGATALNIYCPTQGSETLRTYRKMVKLTPYVCMFPWHTSTSGQTWRWLTADNQVIERTMASLPPGLTGYETYGGQYIRIGSTDIGLAVVSEALPESIDCLPIVAAADHAALAEWAVSLDIPMIGLLGGATTHPNRVASPRLLAGMSGAKPWADAQWFEEIANYDSGSLIGYLHGNALLGAIQVRSTGEGYAGKSSESLPSQIEAINQAIADLGYPDEQLTVVSLAGD